MKENRWELEDLERLTNIEEAFGWRASQHVVGPLRRELLRLERLTGSLEAGIDGPLELTDAVRQQIQDDLNRREQLQDRIYNFGYGAMLVVLTLAATTVIPIPRPPTLPWVRLAIVLVAGVLVARRRIRAHRLV